MNGSDAQVICFTCGLGPFIKLAMLSLLLCFDTDRPGSLGISRVEGGATRWKESGSPSRHL